jgi:predicted RNase H-like nuclease
VILGLDLAWSDRNASGAVALRHAGDGGTPAAPWPPAGYVAGEPETLAGDDDVLCWVEREGRDPPVVLAVDAPLLAPNGTGGREADRATSRLYAWAHAGAYPANSVRCARPVRLAAALEARGWSVCPFELRQVLESARRTDRPPHGRFAIEVYPHAACVGLLGLPRIITYKKGRVATRRAGLARLQELLHERLPALPPAVSPPIGPFVRRDIAALRGRALKGYEDQLDALLCAAMAAAYMHAPAECVIAGASCATEARNGYIVVPRPRRPDSISAVQPSAEAHAPCTS